MNLVGLYPWQYLSLNLADLWQIVAFSFLSSNMVLPWFLLTMKVSPCFGRFQASKTYGIFWPVPC